MQTVRLKTGEIIYPTGAYDGGMLATVFQVSLPGDPDYDERLANAVPADPRDEPVLRKRVAAARKRRAKQSR